MHKLVSIFSLVILYTVLTFGQATVTIPFSGTDGTTTIAIAVGLDLTATNCIDPALGESDLPPFPPAGVFDIRFDLSPYGCPTLSTFIDYQAMQLAFPFTGTDSTYIMVANQSPGVSAINLTYNLPAGQSMTIADQYGRYLLKLVHLLVQWRSSNSGVVILCILTKAFLVMEYLNITPVELTSFTGTVSQDGVILNWTTATELNNQGFEIERTTANQNWEKIGYVPGFGTTTEPKVIFILRSECNDWNIYLSFKTNRL